MRKTILLLIIALSVTNSFAQLYTKAYGSAANPAIIFLHGGPGYNSVGFEMTSAQALADKGYYVVVYDQRGCARSKEMKDNKFTMAEALDDLKSVYETNNIKKATLIGHSWGGTLGTYFAAREPQMVNKVILVGSPYSYPMTIRSIVNNSEKAYRAKNDTTSLKFMTNLRNMDTNSLQYVSISFMQAMRAGLYSVKEPTEEAKAIGAALREVPEAKYLRASEFAPVQGLFDHEHYTSINIAEPMKAAKTKGVSFYGIYGSEDGLYDEAQLSILRKELGETRFTMVKGASHNVFIDQQKEFIRLVTDYNK